MVQFHTQNPNFGKILEGLGMENVCIFYGHLEYFMTILFILWSFGIFCGNLVHFSRFGMLYQDKSGNPARGV
jgi:hypothetical protein